MLRPERICAFFALGFLLSLIPAQAQDCSEFWVCTDWSFCLGSGVQIRECKDANRCGTENLKPDETQKCTPVPPREIALPQSQDTGGITGMILSNAPAVLGIIALVLLLAVYIAYKKLRDIRMFVSPP